LEGCNEGTMLRAEYLRTSYLWWGARVVKKLAYAGRITVRRKGEGPHVADIECPDRHLPMRNCRMYAQRKRSNHTERNGEQHYEVHYSHFFTLAQKKPHVNL